MGFTSLWITRPTSWFTKLPPTTMSERIMATPITTANATKCELPNLATSFS